ncbi:MAG: alpha/beta hydrolase, partial [Ectothiorhodospiraceae bacterium]|nr:alpha/beta hydrolase [Ectothiorhodospiraceae bacterium]
MQTVIDGGINPDLLPSGVRSRRVDNGNGLRMYVLEAGFETPDRPCIVLLHGFPELAYTWRKVLLPLAQAGYHVIAPDQRGYGLTGGWDDRYDSDIAQYRMQNLVADVVGLLRALGYRSAAAVVGHDFGSPVAGYCGLIRPDLFRSVVLMSAPFAGPPAFPLPAESSSSQTPPPTDRQRLHEDLAALDPPRKHYQWYNSTPEANGDMLHCRQGMHAFLRAYFHVKSADGEGNHPEPLRDASAGEFARLPQYYVMELDKTMPETVEPFMPGPEAVAACRWLTEEELRVYSDIYAQTGFQGGLHWYRAGGNPAYQQELRL